MTLMMDFLRLPSPTPLVVSRKLQRCATTDLLALWAPMLSELQPSVVLAESLHWCDASS